MARRPDHARRTGRRLRRGPGAAACADPFPYAVGRAAAWRRHHRAGLGQGRHPHGSALDLGARRPTLRRACPTRSDLPILFRSHQGASRPAPRRLARRAPSRGPRGLQRPLLPRAAHADHQRASPGPRKAQVLRPGRRSEAGPQGQARPRDFPRGLSKPSPTRSKRTVGLASPASSERAASASRTMPPSGRCAASPWAAGHGSWPAPSEAATAPASCTR